MSIAPTDTFLIDTWKKFKSFLNALFNNNKHFFSAVVTNKTLTIMNTQLYYRLLTQYKEDCGKLSKMQLEAYISYIKIQIISE